MCEFTIIVDKQARLQETCGAKVCEFVILYKQEISQEA